MYQAKDFQVLRVKGKRLAVQEVKEQLYEMKWNMMDAEKWM